MEDCYCPPPSLPRPAAAPLWLTAEEQRDEFLISHGARALRKRQRCEEDLRLQRAVYLESVKSWGEGHFETVLEASKYANYLIALKRYKEVKELLRRTLPVAGCVLGKDVYGERLVNILLRMRLVYAEALYKDAGATLDDLREAVATLERMTRGNAHRFVLGDNAHRPRRFVEDIESSLRDARAALRRRGGGPLRLAAAARAAAAPDARRAQTEARSYLPTPWSVEGQAAAERRFLERCRAAERQAAERQRQAEAAARQAEADRLRAATAWTPADEEELAALRLEAARRQREEAAERQRQEAAERQREEAAAARRRRQEAAANKAQEAAKRRAEARPPAGMTGLEMQSWQRRAIDRIRDIDAEKEPDMILGVQRGAPKHEVKEAYKALAILFHPDKCSAPDASDAMQKINTARQKLFLAATSERECAPPPPPPRTPSTSSTPPPRSPPPRPTERCIIQ
jgi:hypothetical protein